MRELKVKDLENEMEEQIKLLKAKKRVEKCEPELCALFNKLTRNQPILNMSNIDYQYVNSNTTLAIKNLIKQAPEFSGDYIEFKNLIIEGSTIALLDSLK